MFILGMFVLKIPACRFRNEHIRIVSKTSGDHLPISDSSRLSIEMSGILNKGAAVSRQSFVDECCSDVGDLAGDPATVTQPSALA